MLPFLVCNLQYILCMFLVGIYGRSHFQAERSTSGTSVGKSTFRQAAVGGVHWGAQAPTPALLECLVAHRRSAKLDQPLSLACLSLPRAHLHLRIAMLRWAAWGSSSWHAAPDHHLVGPATTSGLAVQGWQVLRWWNLTPSCAVCTLLTPYGMLALSASHLAHASGMSVLTTSGKTACVCRPKPDSSLSVVAATSMDKRLTIWPTSAFSGSCFTYNYLVSCASPF